MAAGFGPTTQPQFGIPSADVYGDINSAAELTKGYGAQKIPFEDGWSVEEFTLSLTENASAAKDYGEGCEGIASSQVAARNTFEVPITSARLSIREVTTDPWMKALNDGGVPTKSQRLLCCAGLLVKALNVSLTVLGEYNEAAYPVGFNPAGAPPFGIGTIASSVITLKSAIEVSEELGNALACKFPLESDAGSITVSNPIITDFAVIKRLDGWATFRLTLEGTKGNTETLVGGQTHLIVPKILLLSAIISQSAYYSLEREIELARGAPARMSEIATIYPDADYPDGF
jgi:hypothetical protein